MSHIHKLLVSFLLLATTGLHMTTANAAPYGNQPYPSAMPPPPTYGQAPYGPPGGYGPWNNNGWGGNRGWMPWNGGNMPWGGNRGGWGKQGFANAWDDMLDAPSRMGRMPGGWSAPSFSAPNPIDIGDEFSDAARDIPYQMNDMYQDNRRYNRGGWGW